MTNWQEQIRWGYAPTYTTTSTNTNTTISVMPPPSPPKEEGDGPLAWLDKRINEVREKAFAQ